MESVASVAEGLQEPGADPASDDRRRAGSRMETGGWRLAATRPEEVRILELE